MHVALQLLIEFLPSLTITFLNILVPMIFEKVVRGEDYTPGVEIQLTLIRWVTLQCCTSIDNILINFGFIAVVSLVK